MFVASFNPYRVFGDSHKTWTDYRGADQFTAALGAILAISSGKAKVTGSYAKTMRYTAGANMFVQHMKKTPTEFRAISGSSSFPESSFSRDRFLPRDLKKGSNRLVRPFCFPDGRDDWI